MSDFCSGKVGDIVYSIPAEGEPPTRWFLKQGEKKMVKATNANGDEVDFNPDNFADTPEDARNKAAAREWESLTQGLKDSFKRITAYMKGTR